VVKNESLGHRIVKEHKDSTRRIDLAVAAVMAYDGVGGGDGAADLCVRLKSWLARAPRRPRQRSTFRGEGDSALTVESDPTSAAAYKIKILRAIPQAC
jgi:hypothetical protein